MTVPDEPLFTPIRAGLLPTEVFEQIRTRILDGSLPLGTPVRDSVLAASMGLSRSPVREALRMLEQRGLLRKSPNRSYEVTELTVEDAEELSLLRASYETLALRRAVALGADLAPLEARLQDLTPRDRSRSASTAVIGADARFHVELVRTARMPRLLASYEALRDQIELLLNSGLLVRPEFAGTQLARHRDLLDALREAIESGDAAPAVRLLEWHILSGMQTHLADDGAVLAVPQAGPA